MAQKISEEQQRAEAERRRKKLVKVKNQLPDAEAPEQVVLTDEEKLALKRENRARKQREKRKRNS